MGVRRSIPRKTPHVPGTPTPALPLQGAARGRVSESANRLHTFAAAKKDRGATSSG
jgi:hypothetical protein